MGYSPENCDEDINPEAYKKSENETEQDKEQKKKENEELKAKFETLKNAFNGNNGIASGNTKYTKEETDQMI
jgi:hypothetical protein